jgi:hypothetical protein
LLYAIAMNIPRRRLIKQEANLIRARLKTPRAVIGALRDRLGEFEDRFFATVFLGSGLLFLAMGGRYPFGVGGFGVGGSGTSKIEPKGEVYGLQCLRDFPGWMFRVAMVSLWALQARATFRLDQESRESANSGSGK